MEHKWIEDRGGCHRFDFVGEEIKVVKAAFTENTINLERKGNSGSISKQTRRIARSKEDAENLPVFVHKPGQLAEILECFADATDSEAQEIAQNELIPKYENTYSLERRELGELATELAIEVREHGDEDPVITEEEIKQFTEGLEKSDGFPEQH